MTRNEYISLLKENILSVLFTKKDGEKRSLVCTLREDVIPKDMAPLGNTERKVNDQTVPCWDIEKKAWRSFRIDAVIEHDVVHVAW